MILGAKNILLLFVFTIITSYGLSRDIPYIELINILDENFDNGEELKNIRIIDSLLSSGRLDFYNCLQRGNILNKQGVAYYFLNQEEKAIDIFNNSVLKIWENCDEVSINDLANTTYNIGVAYQYTDQIIKGQDYIERALNMIGSLNVIDTIDLIYKLQGAGSYYLDINDLERAENHYRHALLYLPSGTELKAEKFDVLNQLLLLKINFKQYQEAQIHFQELLYFLDDPEIEIPPSDKAILFLNGAEAAFETKNLEEALERSNTGLEAARRINEGYLIANALQIKGLIAKESGQISTAKNLFDQVVYIRKGLSSNTYGQIGLANIFENQAELSRENGQFREALGYINRAKETLSAEVNLGSGESELISPYEVDLIRVLFIESEILKSIFDQSRDDSLLIRSNQLFDQIDILIQNQIRRPQSEYSKINIYEILSQYYKEASLSAIQGYEYFKEEDQLRRAYHFCAKSKSLILQQRIIESQVAQSDKSIRSNENISKLVSQLVELKKAIVEKSAPEDSLLIKLSSTQNALDAEMRDLQNKNPGIYNEPKTSIQLQAKLERGEILVEFLNIHDSWLCFWMSSNGLSYYQVNDLREASILELIGEFADPSSQISHKKSFMIFQYLLKDGLNRYQPKKILIIPDNILHYLPFEALYTTADDKQFLIEKYAVTYLFSNQWLNLNRHLDGRTFAGFGTTYTPQLNHLLRQKQLINDTLLLPPLTNSHIEVQKASVPFNSHLYLDSLASLQNFMVQSTNADILYLALHGLVNKKYSAQSSIIFDNTSTDDCVLYASDIDGLHLNNPLVVLSSCHSADGKVYNGEGVYGISRAFVAAGAKGIISSLWNASEHSSESVLTTMLSVLDTEKSTSLALQTAKKSYLSAAVPSQRHPYYWANYVAYGDAYFPTNPIGYPYLLFIFFLIPIGIFFYRLFLK